VTINHWARRGSQLESQKERSHPSGPPETPHYTRGSQIAWPGRSVVKGVRVPASASAKKERRIPGEGGGDGAREISPWEREKNESWCPLHVTLAKGCGCRITKNHQKETGKLAARNPRYFLVELQFINRNEKRKKSWCLS